MLQPFIIVLREGFESFLIVAITLAYLRKTGRAALAPAVYWGIVAALGASVALAWALHRGVNQAFWEGVFGVVAMVMVASLVVHMWRMGPRLKQEMERRLDEASTRASGRAAFAGVFLFTLLMIAREGMETALMLFQLRHSSFLPGALLGLSAAVALSWAWARFGHRINLRRFFQVTGVFLLIFVVQIGLYAFHEFCEAGVFPNSEALHVATEPFSPDGLYGKWFSVLMVAGCAAWLAAAGLADKLRRRAAGVGEPQPTS